VKLAKRKRGAGERTVGRGKLEGEQTATAARASLEASTLRLTAQVRLTKLSDDVSDLDMLDLSSDIVRGETIGDRTPTGPWGDAR